MIIFMNNENGNVLNYKDMLKEWNELYDVCEECRMTFGHALYSEL